MKSSNVALVFAFLTIAFLLVTIGFLAGTNSAKDRYEGIYIPQPTVRYDDGVCFFLPGGWYDMTFTPRDEDGNLDTESRYEADYADFINMVTNGQIEVKLSTGRVVTYQIRGCQIVD